MRLCTLKLHGREIAAVVTATGIVPVDRINAFLGLAWPTDLLTLIQQGLSPVLQRDAERTPGALPPTSVSIAPLVPASAQDLGDRSELQGPCRRPRCAVSHRASFFHER